MRNVILLILLLSIITPAFAKQKVLIIPPKDEADKRNVYTRALLQKVLDITTKEYGKAEIAHTISMSRDRAYKELLKGDKLHVHPVVPKGNWEDTLETVYIPIRKGLMGYRLFFIHKDRQKMFNGIKSIDELMKLSAGMGEQWSITRIFKEEKFRVTTSPVYDHLFVMLMKKRYDYFPRGVNEIYPEFEAKSKKHKNLAIEKNLSLFVPLPVYFFISPKKKKLAERIRVGLNRMIADGSFDKIFNKFHMPIIKKAGLSKRRYFEMGNPFLKSKAPLKNKKLWYSPRK